MKILTIIIANYKELKGIKKFLVCFSIFMIIIIILSKIPLLKELWVQYMPELYKNIISTSLQGLRIEDIFGLIFFIIIIAILLTSGEKMNLETVRVCLTPLNEEIHLENITIKNEGEADYLKDRTWQNVDDYDWRKKYNNNRVIISAILTTKSKEYIITKMKLRWKYVAGNQSAISSCEVIKPVLRWHATLEIDPTDTSEKEKIINLNPALIIRPNEQLYDVCNLEIELFYKLINLDCHPCANWDILYSIILLDHQGKEYNLILNRNWRNIPAEDIMI